MENIKPYLGKIEDTACFLNNGKYGWYLNYNDKLYSVPESFQSKKFDIQTAKKIIDWKNAHPSPTKPPTIAQLDAFEAQANIVESNQAQVQNRIKEYGSIAEQIEYITENGMITIL